MHNYITVGDKVNYSIDYAGTLTGTANTRGLLMRRLLYSDSKVLIPKWYPFMDEA